MSDEDIAVAVDHLAREGTVVMVGDVIADAATWRAVARKAAEVIDAPLLDYLDRTFVALRQGDKRTVRR